MFSKAPEVNSASSYALLIVKLVTKKRIKRTMQCFDKIAGGQWPLWWSSRRGPNKPVVAECSPGWWSATWCLSETDGCSPG